MIKTKKMLDVEFELGEPLKDFIDREYNEREKRQDEIAKELGISQRSVANWIRELSIANSRRCKRRRNGKTTTMTKAEEKIGEPIRDFLRRSYYDENLSSMKIARILSVTDSCVLGWMREFGIKIRSSQETKRPNFIVPSRDELEYMYLTQNLSSVQIGKNLGVSSPTVRRWLKTEGISIRKNSSRAPSKFYLEDLYVNKRLSSVKIAEKMGVSSTTVLRWLRVSGIAIDGKSKLPELQEIVNTDPEITSLMNISINLTEDQRQRIESIILKLYEAMFKDTVQLRSFIEENKEKILTTVQKGVTCLGPYIGNLDVCEKPITPLYMGKIIEIIGDRRTVSIDDLIYGLLRQTYTASFNRNPSGTLEELERRIAEVGPVNSKMYERLRDHYKSVLDLEAEIQ